MNLPNPALVTDRDTSPLPRAALFALCACWLLPGLISRDPWRGADIIAYALMQAMHISNDWWTPTLAGDRFDAPLLPHWLGAASIRLLSPLMEAEVAARLPFALLVAGTMACVWTSAHHLARTPQAQPVRLAFGGEAPTDVYARALADASLLALLATLGLVQLGHEATPEIVQLFAISAGLLSLAWGRDHPRRARLGVMVSMAAVAASGAPGVASACALAAAWACHRSPLTCLRGLRPWCVLAFAAAAAVGHFLGDWRWTLNPGLAAQEAHLLLRQWVWFTWPIGPLALWTLWQWRGQWISPHVAAPLSMLSAPALISVLMGGEDQVLLLSLPGMAVLAAFSLPTIRRSASAAVDWFSVFFFSFAALFIWFMYVAMHSGVPTKPAANVARLVAGYSPVFSWLHLTLGIAATLAWLWLVRWRTGRHRRALWKSLILPASGVVLCWMLLMSLWFPLIDYARSGRPIADRVLALAVPSRCMVVDGASSAMLATLQVYMPRPVSQSPSSTREENCDVLVTVRRQEPPPELSGWTPVGAFKRPTDRAETISVYRR